MPRNLKKKPMELHCEWCSTKEVFEDMPFYLLHIKSHMLEFLPKGITPDNYMDFNIVIEGTVEYHCLWRNCGYITNGPISLLRHLYFHAYHTKLKWWGHQERVKMGKALCQLDAQGGNLIPELPQSFQCGWQGCEFVTDNPEAFHYHAEDHGIESVGEVEDGKIIHRCEWQSCTSITKNNFKLQDHIRTHTQAKQYACVVCGSLFANRSKFFDHIHRQIALDQQKFQCSHCSKIYATERLLRDHIRSHVNNYKCPHCEMTCPAPSGIQKHIRWRHSNERPFACQYCDRSFKSLSGLRGHLDCHNQQQIYECCFENCKFRSTTLSNLQCHFNIYHKFQGKACYSCHLCDKKFTRGFSLTKHLKGIHKLKWPAGHSRFRYKCYDDGLYRLQTVRYESVELTEQLIMERGNAEQTNASTSQSDVSQNPEQAVEVVVEMPQWPQVAVEITATSQ
ncbi:histone H4 transcription factor-like [Anneissia japonica]|uniref:histone H4 transcription factor-like n=1 Tax=Anneissia japonica TaxID=1529436 RepID=UPI001425559F|nr:histone H4 transcription factor-like [Anneissia japonica]